MIGHIYGKNNVMVRTDRPHMFLKELTLYIDYLKNKITELKGSDETYIEKFRANLDSGIEYYKRLFSGDIVQLSLLEKIESKMFSLV